MSTLDAKLTELATQALAAHGLVLVQARLMGGSVAGSSKRGKLTLSVLAENATGGSPTVEECTAASRTLSAQLDVADIMTAAYVLEVGSPGLERPLMTMADYQRFVGKQAKLTFTRAKKFDKVALGSVVGVLLPSDGRVVNIQPIDMPTPLAIDLDDIRYAHLTPSAAELKELMKQANAHTKALSAEAEPDAA